MRVGVLSIQHESNTFLAAHTTLEHFKQDRFLIGEAVRTSQAEAHHEVGGFFEGLDRERMDAVPLLMAVAVPSGVVTRQTLDELVGITFDQIGRAGPLDGILVAPHGAAVAQDHPDMDGYWLTLLRMRVGPEVPIICTLDLHANVSQAMVDASDAMISYRSNPHMDQRQRGVEAATLMARTLRREVRPTQAVVTPPLLINIERQLTSVEPCRSLFARADAVRETDGVLGGSINLGFPYADVPEVGASFIVVTDDDAHLARRLARELADHAWINRESFRPELISIDQAIELARRSPKPVCLLDMGDNVGGGSAADGTVLAHTLHRAGDLRAFVCLNDPGVVNICRSAGEGAVLSLSMGGKTDGMHGLPLTVKVIVKRLHDGLFNEHLPRHGGRTQYDMGPTAIVETQNGLTIQITSLRTAPFSLGQISSCGLDAHRFDVIVAKGVHAPVAAYEPVCKTFIRVNTPGSTTADLNSLTFTRRRRPLFPLD
jgi:microcystin degradation protein MlrC